MKPAHRHRSLEEKAERIGFWVIIAACVYLSLRAFIPFVIDIL